MNITLASIFVDSCEYLPRYFAQCVALSDALLARGDAVDFLWGEGDSTDNTRRALTAMRWRLKARVVDVSHGGQIFMSVVREERFRQLAGVGRKLFAEIDEGCDVVVYAESDLIWSVETALALIDHVGPGYEAVAPPILLERAGWGARSWYDTFCFRSGGKHFQHRPPYHPGNDGRKPLEMETVGSMLAIDAEYMRKAAATYDERVIMGLCEDVRALGGRVWLDPMIEAVIHE